MNFNPFENMFKANQEMMEAWKSFIPNPDKGSDAKKENSYSEDFLNYQKAFFENWNEMANKWWNFEGSKKGIFNGVDYFDIMKNYYGIWTNHFNNFNPYQAMNFMNPSNYQVFMKMFNASNLYNSMYQNWEPFNKNIAKPFTENYEEELKKYVDFYNKMFMENYIPLMPEEVQGFLKTTNSYFNTYLNTISNFVLGICAKKHL